MFTCFVIYTALLQIWFCQKLGTFWGNNFQPGNLSVCKALTELVVLYSLYSPFAYVFFSSFFWFSCYILYMPGFPSGFPLHSISVAIPVCSKLDLSNSLIQFIQLWSPFLKIICQTWLVKLAVRPNLKL